MIYDAWYSIKDRNALAIIKYTEEDEFIGVRAVHIIYDQMDKIWSLQWAFKVLSWTHLSFSLDSSFIVSSSVDDQHRRGENTFSPSLNLESSVFSGNAEEKETFGDLL